MTAADIATTLRATPLFASLRDNEIDEIASISSLRNFAAGEDIFAQGDRGRSAMVIASGHVAIYLGTRDAGVPLVTLGAHEILGELSLIEPDLRSANARAEDDVTVVEIGHDEFMALREDLSASAHKVLRSLSRVLCSRIRGVNERIEDMLAHTEPEAPAGVTGARAAEPDENALRRILSRLWSSSSES